MTAFGVGLGALLRAQVPTVAGVLVWALIIEPTVAALKPAIGKLLPFEAFQQAQPSADAPTRRGRGQQRAVAARRLSW